jgi:hypothetical protein
MTTSAAAASELKANIQQLRLELDGKDGEIATLLSSITCVRPEARTWLVIDVSAGWAEPVFSCLSAATETLGTWGGAWVWVRHAHSSSHQSFKTHLYPAEATTTTTRALEEQLEGAQQVQLQLTAARAALSASAATNGMLSLELSTTKQRYGVAGCAEARPG